MSNVWDRFEGIASTEEVNEAKKKFTPIDAGVYDMALEEITPAESKEGLPMVKGKFRTVEGNKVVFYNQMLQNLNYPNMTSANIAEAVSFVSGLLGEEIEFTGLGALAKTIETIPTGGIYSIKVSYGQKDIEMKYPRLKVMGKVDGDLVPEEDDLPF